MGLINFSALMPGNLFNLGRYFKNDQKTPPTTTDGQDKTVITTKEEITTTSPQSYSGIGKTPGGGEPYNGIGKPPSKPEDKGTSEQKTNIPPSSSSSSPQQQQSAIDMNKRSGMDVLTRLTQRSTQVLMVGVNKAKELGAKYIDTEHVLWGLLQDAQIYQLLSDLKAVPKQIQDDLEKNFKKGTFVGQPQFSPRIKKVLELALATARALKLEFISPEHILLALVQEGEGMAAQTLIKFNITVEALNKKVTGKKEGVAEEEEKGKTSTIEQYCEDLTQKAKEGKLDPVVGRSAEIERVIHILSRRTKNNPVLIGDAGVGKTAIVEGLAQKIASGDVPETLANKRILQLDLMSLIAGAKHRGDFEERLKNLIKEVKATSGAIILFIDEIHNMVGAGGGGEGSMDASNILKPSLARGELQTIGTTTITEYRKYIEKDPALERRFQPIQVLEPSSDQAVEMLYALRDKYEAFHKVSISDESIESAVRLSKQYVGDRFLPDKAVDLIDEAGAAVRLPAISLPEEIKSLQEKLVRLESERKEAEKINDNLRITNINKETEETKTLLEEKRQAFEKKKSTTTNVVSPEIIQEIVSRWTNIPISKLTEKESDKLITLEDLLHKRIIDQEQAVTAISEAVRRGRAGLKSSKRPIGSFIFMGPTGVGKTELAKVLAEILFGSEEMIVRLDMTEYMERHEVAKLIGAPPGYVGYEEGGQLTEAVRRHPYSVVLFDEIEKAHPDVFNILIQLLDDGRLTDNKGHTISFKNTIVICTSNIGTGLIQQEMIKSDNLPKNTDGQKPDQDKQIFDLAKVAQINNLVNDQIKAIFLALLEEGIYQKPQLLAAITRDESRLQTVVDKTGLEKAKLTLLLQEVANLQQTLNYQQLTEKTQLTEPEIKTVFKAVSEVMIDCDLQDIQILQEVSLSEDKVQELAQGMQLEVELVKKIIADIKTSLSSIIETKAEVETEDKFVNLTNLLLDELRKFFRPELLNRFDEIIVFKPLTQEHMLQIVELQVNQLAKLLEDQNFGFQVSPQAKEKLAKLGFDPIYGARPLRRTIQRYLENAISSMLIKGEVKVGDTVIVDCQNDEFVFSGKKAEPVKEILDKEQIPEKDKIQNQAEPIPVNTIQEPKVVQSPEQNPDTSSKDNSPLSSYFPEDLSANTNPADQKDVSAVS